jgi:hypothetical protein
MGPKDGKIGPGAGNVGSRDANEDPRDGSLTLGRCLLAGLLTGIITSVIILIFNVIYRGATHYYVQEGIMPLIMPLSIFMGFPLLLLLTGGVFFLFVEHLKRGAALYSAIIILLTLASAFVTAFADKTGSPEVEGFRGMVFGAELITGVLGAFVVPFFARHPGLYLTGKDIKGEE